MTKSDNGERARGRNRVDRLDWGERRVKYERSYVGRGEKIVPDDVENPVDEPSGRTREFRTSGQTLRGTVECLSQPESASEQTWPHCHRRVACCLRF